MKQAVSPSRIITITKTAERLFKKLPQSVQTQIKAEVQILKTDSLKGAQLLGKYR